MRSDIANKKRGGTKSEDCCRPQGRLVPLFPAEETGGKGLSHEIDPKNAERPEDSGDRPHSVKSPERLGVMSYHRPESGIARDKVYIPDILHLHVEKLIHEGSIVVQP